ncbi:MAG TPA: zinc-binding dehydrogenase [Xanthobacteraceae bacterium]|nr:zinc-binding dehydrogenase [Xanthobacteraceae bacterium]
MLAVINTPDDKDPVAIREVPEPSPAPGEAVVAVDAFSLNRGELVLLESRAAGWRPGQDIAGTIVRAAADGSGPPAGARVVALVEGSGWAERVAARTDRMAVLADGVRSEDAAALPIPGLTALRALRRGGLILGKRVMITGATGIVGSLAIALGAAAGARITAVARKDAHADLRARGAHATVETPTEAEGPFDLILESVGGASLRGAIERIAPHGAIVVYGNTSGEATPVSFTDFRRGQNARIESLFHFTAEPPSAFGPDLAILAELLARKTITPAVSGTHDWTALAQVIAALRSGRFRGKPVFRIVATQAAR